MLQANTSVMHTNHSQFTMKLSTAQNTGIPLTTVCS